MNEKQANNGKPARPAVDWPAIICISAGYPIELLFHDIRTFGVRAIGSRATISLLLMAVFIGFHPKDNPAPLGFSMLGTIAGSILAFAIAKIRQWRGARVHSRYNGRPYLMWVSPFSEATVKRIEPLIAFAIGCGAHCANAPLGSFVMLASFCEALKVMFDRIQKSDQALDINDALIEQSTALQTANRIPRP